VQQCRHYYSHHCYHHRRCHCCASVSTFSLSDDIDIERDAKVMKQLKQRLAAVVYKPVFISRVQHLPSFKNGQTI
jgi:hypothetical protein